MTQPAQVSVPFDQAGGEVCPVSEPHEWRYVPEGAGNGGHVVISPLGISSPNSETEWRATHEEARQ